METSASSKEKKTLLFFSWHHVSGHMGMESPINVNRWRWPLTPKAFPLSLHLKAHPHKNSPLEKVTLTPHSSKDQVGFSNNSWRGVYVESAVVWCKITLFCYLTIVIKNLL